MKVLVIAPYLPYPPDHGGKIRVYELLRRLAPHHEITLAALLDSDEDRRYLPEVEALGVRVLAATRPAVRHDTAARLRRFFDPQPRLLREHYSHKLSMLIKRELQERPPDIIQCEQFQMAQYTSHIQQPPRLLVEQNIEYDLLMQIAKARPSWVSRTAGYLDALKVRRVERRAWAAFEACATVSTLERAVIARYAPNTRLYVVPNGVDTDQFRPSTAEPAPGSLIITGTVGYYPNLDGILWFIHSILPTVRKDFPGAVLRIVGQANSAARQRIGMHENVVMTGRVPDVRPYVASSMVFVVPLRIGGGTRLKVLEAMAQGIPVVSTTRGCEGIDVTGGKHLLIADTPEQFAEAITRLLRDAALTSTLSANARRLVEARYDWSRSAAQLDAAYKDNA